MVSALHQASYLRKKELVALDSGKQTTVGSGGFFVYRQQITRRKKGSQEDPLIFLSPPPPPERHKFVFITFDNIRNII